MLLIYNSYTWSDLNMFRYVYIFVAASFNSQELEGKLSEVKQKILQTERRIFLPN